MMRVEVFGACVATLLLLALPTAAMPVLTVQPAVTTVGLGDYFTVDIVINNVVDLYGVDLDISFDTAIMDFDSYASGAFLSSDGDSTFVIAPGVDELSGFLDSYVETILSSADGVSGSGVLLSLTFQATSLGSGLIEIAAVLGNSDLEEIAHATESGLVNVVPEPASIIMLGATGAGLLIMRRRRGK